MSEKIFGIDISKYQKGISLEKAKAEGVKFAVIKASQADFADPHFEEHYGNAKKNSLAVGAYHYLVATDEAQAVSHAKILIDKCLKNKSFEYPIFADCEDKVLKALPKAKVDSIIKAFCNTLESAGYWAGFYCNHDFYKNNCSGESLAKRYSHWHAAWTEKPLADCQMWQFGGETNLIRTNQIAGMTCDQNYCYMDYPMLIKQKGLNGFAKSAVKPSASASKPAVSAPEKTESPALKVGDRVKMQKGAPVWNGGGYFASWVYDATLYVREVGGNRIVISTVKNGPVTGAVDVKYLTKL